jgi:hypothetical protein
MVLDSFAIGDVMYGWRPGAHSLEFYTELKNVCIKL